MARTVAVIITIFLFTIIGVSHAHAQSSLGDSYELIPAPDLWYNDVDGIRIGLRIQGQVPGTFEDGPHRLDAGLWLGLWFPDYPVSYYISYTNPIPDWSDFGSEANIQAITSIRTGYSMHGIGLNKRWQQGFDERRFREFSLFNSVEKRFETEYAAFPILWSDWLREESRGKILSSISAGLQDDNFLGWYNLSLAGSVQYRDDSYIFGTLTATQNILFNDSWSMRFRGFLGFASAATDTEYLFSRSTGQAINTLQNGVTRAKGTIPQPWMESGNFQIAGGANLRGYTADDVESFKYIVDPAGTTFIVPSNLYRSIAAFNTELDYPNPVKNMFEAIPYVTEFLNFRSYLFFDAGSPLGLDNESSVLYADAGAGFSLSLIIPDYQGKVRGFVFRYDIPFWLSEPGTGKPFKYRSLFAFGAVIPF